MIPFVAILLIMTAAATAVIAWPFLSRRGTERSGSDLEVYRDQLKELERDQDAGLISSQDAEAARLEISRRLLSVTRQAKTPLKQPDLKSRSGARAFALAAALIAVPALSAAMYVRLGSPDLRGNNETNATESRAGESQTIERMVAQVEAHLQRNPNDGRGWEVLAPVYAKLGRYEDSARAWRAAIDRLGENADRLESLGESMVAAADGVVTADAKVVFQRALAIDSTAIAARYYRGLAAKQDGLPDEAAKIWRDLIASGPQDAGWVKSVRAALSRLESSPVADASGPAQTNIETAAKLSTQEQSHFVQAMVGRLAERLKSDGSDPDEWVKLVRSYRVLGQAREADAAIADARTILGKDATKLARFNEGLSAMDAGASADKALPDSVSEAAAGAPAPMQDDVKSGMTQRLAERLRSGGGEPEAWVLLVRSYTVLGKTDRAKAAIGDAHRTFADSPEKLARFEQGLKSVEAVANAPQDQNIAASPPPPPSSSPNPAAAADDPDAMIRGMVAKLAERLGKDGGDAEAWLRLVRSYSVLGEKDKALAAIAEARRNIGSDQAQLRFFEDGVSKLGLAVN
jgi:cytochrome c-type biogenesis protein CcmH